MIINTVPETVNLDERYELQKAQVVTVAESGGDFTDIKAAADSITDSSITKRYVIQVNPGYYSVGQTIQLPQYTSIRGTGGTTDTVLWYTGGDPIIEFDNLGSDSVVQNVTFFVPPLVDTGPTVIKQHDGRHALITCFLLMQTGNAGAKCTAVDIDDGSLVLQALVVYYTFGGSKVGANTHEIIKLNGGDLGMASCDWRIDVNDVDDDVIFINDSSNEAAVFWVCGNTSTRMNLNNAAYSGTAYWYKASGDVIDRNIMANSVTLKGNGSGTGYIYSVDTTTGTATINSSSNQISITGFTNNYFSDIAAGDTLNTFFDDIVAADGETGAGTYNYANSPSPNVFAAGQIQLDNNNGNAIEFPTGQLAGEAKNYTFDMGCGSTAVTDGNGTVTFKMDACVGNTVNQFIVDLGNVYFAGANTNDFIFQSFNGQATYGFVSAFGGFNNPEYGWELRRISGADATGKTMVFDNQTPNSDFRRSIDFRIGGTDFLTMENDGDIDFPQGKITAPALLSVTAPTGLQVNGYGALTSTTVFNLVDIFTVKATTTNRPVVLGMRPDGTSTNSLIFVTNSADTSNYGFLEGSVNGTVARLTTCRLNTGIGPTQLIVGEALSGFLGLGTADSLTTIDFYIANAAECQIQPDTMIFNNGATDCQIDWATNGQLGLQVATNDIIRLTATQIQAIQDIVISDAQNIILNTVTGSQIGTAAAQKLAFYGAAPIIQPSAYTQTYATATKTHAARTAPGAGTGSGADATTFSGAECDALAADQQNTAQVLNQLIDDLQALGLVA